jgi:hypothetical protein
MRCLQAISSVVLGMGLHQGVEVVQVHSFSPSSQRRQLRHHLYISHRGGLHLQGGSSRVASLPLLLGMYPAENAQEECNDITYYDPTCTSSSSHQKLSLSPLERRRSFVDKMTSALRIGGSTIAMSFLPGSISVARAAATAEATIPISTPPYSNQLSWPIGKVAFSLLPLAGTGTRRATIEETIVPGQIWTHDQIQGVVNVNVPVRQTVIKLSNHAGGGLWIHNPIAPTQQALQMVRALELEHGPVRHLVLASSALEHKATFGPFAAKFPNATVWIQPGQWAFPAGLPIEFLGVTQRGPRLREIPDRDTGQLVVGSSNSSNRYRYFDDKLGPPEWLGEHDFDYETLGPLTFKSVGTYSETVFCHKPTETLLVTDCVVSVQAEPPMIIQEDPRAMLFHARDRADEIVQDTPATRRKGWRRMVQFGLVFFPSQIEVVPSLGQAFKDASQITPGMRPLGEGAVPFALYPWTWHDNDADQANFDQISQHGKPFCPPILTKLILDREPQRVETFVNRVVSRFTFTRIIPCHLANNVTAGPREFKEAFDMIIRDPTNNGNQVKSQRPLAEDLALLQKASDLLTRFNVVEVSTVCDGEPARMVGRFATAAASNK